MTSAPVQVKGCAMHLNKCRASSQPSTNAACWHERKPEACAVAGAVYHAVYPSCQFCPAGGLLLSERQVFFLLLQDCLKALTGVQLLTSCVSLQAVQAGDEPFKEQRAY